VNFFTSQRLVRLQDRSNEQNFVAAPEEWERALEAYKQHLLRVQGALPHDMKQLLDTVSLHDAQVLDMWWGGRTQFTITLHAWSDPSRLVVLSYSLVEPPAVEQDVLPESVRSKPIAWLYDELDVRGGTRGREPAFTHRVLLSDGREVHLHFRNVTVKRPVPLVPAAPAGGEDHSSVRHSA
jgi:hypothetical protein